MEWGKHLTFPAKGREPTPTAAGQLTFAIASLRASSRSDWQIEKNNGTITIDLTATTVDCLIRGLSSQTEGGS